MEKDDTDFMDELEAAAELKPSRAANAMLYSVLALIIVFIFWASFFEIEEITRGQGQVVPSRETQVIQSLEGGILQESLVNEGDLVTKGQILMRISDIAFASEERGTEAKFNSLQIKKTRLRAEAAGEDFVLDEDLAATSPDVAKNEMAHYLSRQRELENALSISRDKVKAAHAGIKETQADIDRFKDKAGLLHQELKITKEMVAQKAMPKIEEIRLRRELSEIDGQLNAAEERLPGLQAELSAAKRELEDQTDKFRSQALGELNEVETQISQLKESLKSIEDRVYRTELRSPVDGTVNNIAIKTIGGVIEPAQKLIEIVPLDDELKIIAKVRPSDIAFLEIGQLVKVKISAYDPQIYGSLDGKLVRIGANSVTDNEGNIFFEIEVRTERNFLGTPERPLPIRPGMVADTEVITGHRTIMHYLTKPVRRAWSRALRER